MNLRLLKPELWERGLTCLNSPPLVARVIARLDVVAGEGEYLEVGTREGGSALLRAAHMPDGAVLVTVDPYGDKPFHGGPGLYGYSTEERALERLHVLPEHGIHWQAWRMLSLDFFRLIVPLGYWHRGQHVAYRWRTAFLDGDHSSQNVAAEILEVAERLVPKGSIVVDNANHEQAEGLDHGAAIRAAAAMAGLGCALLDMGDGDVIAVLSRDPDNLSRAANKHTH